MTVDKRIPNPPGCEIDRDDEALNEQAKEIADEIDKEIIAKLIKDIEDGNL